MDQNSKAYFDGWEPNFRARAPDYKSGPADRRPCRDICCLILFFLILAAFVGIAAYTINQGWSGFQGDPKVTADEITKAIQNNLGKFLGVVIGMGVLSLVMSIILLCLIKAFPKCMIYTMIILMALILIGLAVVCFVYGSVAGGVIVLVILAIYFLIYCCCMRQHIDSAVVLTRVTGVFITQNPSSFVSPIFVTIISIGFALIWIASIAGLIYMDSKKVASQEVTDALFVTQAVLYVFFCFFFYYVMVFLISSTVVNWYYQETGKSPFCTGLRWLICSHIGSLTFGAVVITIIKILQLLLNYGQRSTGNTCAKICLCLVQCVLSCINGIVQTLNHYSTICMAFTGESYIDSAKDAGVIILTNPGLFTTVNMVTGFFFFTIVLFCIGLPTIIGIIIAQIYGLAAISGVVAIIVLVVSLLVSLTFVTMFSESMSAIFVFYCMDLRLRQYGVNVVNIPREIKEHFDPLFRNNPDGGMRAEAGTEKQIRNPH